ncbi:hypothetical protein FNH22_06535 [Fulvivirga sp. M361]|uniref:hypothetical protein n=1 Tax=Fulvivirga sp. M361 TaxID=2594266 RepID=UPI00117A9826|nr:hypothetical protein [Fulvivirga sp. M361]TRX60697.1 hypothetical protein FNH22_06535 [Fulvivirga sp. M361]
MKNLFVFVLIISSFFAFGFAEISPDVEKSNSFISQESTQCPCPFCDFDGDGFMNVEEFRICYPGVGPAIYVIIDVNGDGLIDMDEHAAACAAGILC